MDECSLGPCASIPQSNEDANSDFFPTPAFMPPRAPSRLGSTIRLSLGFEPVGDCAADEVCDVAHHQH